MKDQEIKKMNNDIMDNKETELKDLREARSLALEKAYVHDVYDQIAPHFSETQYRAWPKVKQFLMELDPGSLVADVGCGNGKYLNFNREIYKIGLDRCTKLVEIAHQKHHEVLISDNMHLPFKDETFDGVLSIAVIHHFATVERRVQALRELARILRIGGRVMISVWAMEQERRKFESQEVLVPWHQQNFHGSEEMGSSFDKDFSSTASGSEEDVSFLDDLPNEFRNSRVLQKSKSLEERQRHTFRNHHMRVIDNSGSSTDLSSPDQTCYSFVKKAFRRFSTTAAGSEFYRDYRINNSQFCRTNRLKMKHQDCFDLENSNNIPIEIRQFEDEILDKATSPTTPTNIKQLQRSNTLPAQTKQTNLNHKSKSLTDILSLLPSILRPWKSTESTNVNDSNSVNNFKNYKKSYHIRTIPSMPSISSVDEIDETKHNFRIGQNTLQELQENSLKKSVSSISSIFSWEEVDHNLKVTKLGHQTSTTSSCSSEKEDDKVEKAVSNGICTPKCENGVKNKDILYRNLINHIVTHENHIFQNPSCNSSPEFAVREFPQSSSPDEPKSPPGEKELEVLIENPVPPEALNNIAKVSVKSSSIDVSDLHSFKTNTSMQLNIHKSATDSKVAHLINYQSNISNDSGICVTERNVDVEINPLPEDLEMLSDDNMNEGNNEKDLDEANNNETVKENNPEEVCSITINSVYEPEQELMKDDLKDETEKVSTDLELDSSSTSKPFTLTLGLAPNDPSKSNKPLTPGGLTPRRNPFGEPDDPPQFDLNDYANELMLITDSSNSSICTAVKINPNSKDNKNSKKSFALGHDNLEDQVHSSSFESISLSPSKDSLTSNNENGTSATYHRYYHVFREGELDELIDQQVENLHILHSYYDHANWCIVAEKVHVWKI